MAWFAPLAAETAVRCALVCACALLVASGAGSARAQGRETGGAGAEPPAADPRQVEADELKRKGDVAMHELRYAEALELYDRSYALKPNPALLYNRGRALEALARFPEALDQLERFVRVAPAALKARVPHVGERIEGLRRKITTVRIRANVRGARVLVRSKAVATTPVRVPLRVNSGRAVVEVTAEGYYPFEKRLVLPGGGSIDLVAKLVSKATSGVLVVTSTVPGAVVFVDGKRLGTAPAERRLEKGKHAIVVRAEGYEEAETTAVVVAGRQKRVRIPLEETPPITARWWFWTGTGLVVAGGVALAIALTTERPAGEGDLTPGRVPGPLVRF